VLSSETRLTQSLAGCRDDPDRSATRFAIV
jgi:hypothetical protein